MKEASKHSYLSLSEQFKHFDIIPNMPLNTVNLNSDITWGMLKG